MEQTETTTTPIMESGKQGNGKGLKIVTALACAVAACGIGFGVYGMIQSSQKDNQISDLKVQVKDNNGTITTIETPEIETTTDNGTTVTITDTVAATENTEDYIYVGEWGLKIKISDELTNISYEYLGDGYHRSCRLLGLSASTKGDGSKPAFVKTGSDDGDYLGYITRCPEEDASPYGTPVDIDDPGYVYSYNMIQSYITQTQIDWEAESIEAIKNMLTNPDNYSAI